jgi:CBS domain-containing protein
MITVEHLLRGKGNSAWHVAPHSKVYDALKELADKDVGALLVVEGEKLVGIFSERDYARKVALKGKTSVDTPVWEIMTQTVTTIKPETTIEECMELMTDKHIRHLPVLVDGKVVGVVSIGDIVKAIISKQAGTIRDLEKYITGADYNR